MIDSLRSWPYGRVGRVTLGDDAGLYAFVEPEVAGQWMIYLGEDPSDTPTTRQPRSTDWLLRDEQALVNVLGELGLIWLDGDEERQVEEELFGLRSRRARQPSPWWRAWKDRSRS